MGAMGTDQQNQWGLGGDIYWWHNIINKCSSNKYMCNLLCFGRAFFCGNAHTKPVLVNTIEAKVEIMDLIRNQSRFFIYMNINDRAVSVIKVECADRLIVKLALPAVKKTIDDAITHAIQPNTPSNFTGDLTGKIVLAKFRGENGYTYERAVVKSVSRSNFSQNKDLQVNVEFIDGGQFDVVPLASLLPCPESIKKFEPLVRTLLLANLKPLVWQPKLNAETCKIMSLQEAGDVWEPSATYHVENLLRYFGTGCRAEVLRTDEMGNWRGDLHFSRDGRLQSLRHYLIDSKFAFEVMTEPPPDLTPKIPLAGNRIDGAKGPRAAAANRSPNSNKNLQQNIMNSYLVCGGKPHPAPLEGSDLSKYSQIVNRTHTFTPFAYQPLVWGATDMARHTFLTMPPEMVQLDENAISVVLPSLFDALEVPPKPTSNQLNAIFVVPSGPIGSKLQSQLSKTPVGLKKVTFLYSVSDGDVSGSQVLIVNPCKLSQCLKNTGVLKLENLRFLSFLFIDELMKSEEDRQVLSQFKQEVSRYRELIKSIRLFGLTKTFSSQVTQFFYEWFRTHNPLAYFLDLAEASVCYQTRHSFVHAQSDVFPRCLMETLQNLQKNRHKIAIFCQDNDFNWILSILRQNSVTVLPLEPQLAGLSNELTAEYHNWALSPEKQCLLIPDSLMRPEVGLKAHATVVPTALIHAVTIQNKTAFRNRFILMKPNWSSNSGELPTTPSTNESILLLDRLPLEMCIYLNDLLKRSGGKPSPVIADWALKTTKPTAQVAVNTAPQQQQASSPSPKPDGSNDLCPTLLSLGKCSDESTCLMRHVFTAELDDCCAQSSHYTPVAHLKSGGLAYFQIQRIVSGNHFIGLLKSPKSCVESLLRIDRQLCICRKQQKEGKTVLPVPKIGHLYGAAFDNSCVFRRAVVVKDLGISEDNFYTKSAVLKNTLPQQLYSYRVRLVDHGACEVEVQGDQLFPLSDDLKQEPWLSVDIILCNIRPADRAWPKEVLEQLKTKLQGREVEASVALVMRRHIFVTQLFHREVCSAIGNELATVTDVRSLLVDRFGAEAASPGLANPIHLRTLVEKCLQANLTVPSSTQSSFQLAAETTTPTQQVVLPVKTTLKPSETKVLEEFSLKIDEDSLVGCDKVRISAVECPSTFFVQRIDSLDEFGRLERAIDEWVRSDPDPPPMSWEHLAPDCHCLARLPIDGGQYWSRVRIENVYPDSQTVRVFSVDHGDLDTIPFTDLRTMSVHLLSYKAFAIECRLAHVTYNTDFNKEAFTEEAGNALWEMGLIPRENHLSRAFRARVVDKATVRFHCKSECYVVEMMPAVDLEKAMPPFNEHNDLSLSSQLIQLGLVFPDFTVVKNKLNKLELRQNASVVVTQLVRELLPAILDNSDLVETEFWPWFNANSQQFFADFQKEKVSVRCRFLDCLVTIIEIGDQYQLSMVVELLFLAKLFNPDLETSDVERDLLHQALFAIARRLFPIATFYVSVSLEAVKPEDDDYNACLICDLLAQLLPLVTSAENGNDFAQEAVQLCVRSGLMTALVRLTSRENVDKMSSCFHLLAAMISGPVFKTWLRRMNAFKSTPFSAGRFVETHPWERFSAIVQQLVNNSCPKLLLTLLSSFRAVMDEGGDFIDIIEESELGKTLMEVKKQLLARKNNEIGEWNDVLSILHQLGMLFTIKQSSFDPETDSDRFGQKRSRPSYRLPPSAQGSEYVASVVDSHSFGNILWSQNASIVHLQFDNPAIVKQNLLALLVVPDGSPNQVLRITMMNVHRSLDIHLFGKVFDEEISVRDKFSGAELKLRKKTDGEWASLETPGKRLAIVKLNFNEVHMDWSDDDCSEEENNEIAEEYKNVMLDQNKEDGLVGVANGNENGVEEQLLNKARARLPEDFLGDDDDGFE